MQEGKSIKQKLIKIILLTSGLVLAVTSLTYLVYDVVTFRQSSIRQLSVLGRIIASNNTAALTFDDANSANEILSSLRAETHITSAALYDAHGKLFASYPSDLETSKFPTNLEADGYRFEDSYLVGFQPVVLDNSRLGTLYIKSDMGALYSRLQLYASIVLLVIILSFLVAYPVSERLQGRVSRPILALAETVRSVTERKDYSIRAEKLTDGELGILTQGINQMLVQIETQTTEINEFNKNLSIKIAERTEALAAVNKELEAFSYSVSHDLRAPLRSISGYAKILIDDYQSKLDKSGNQALETITRNAVRMGRLIDDLLTFSRVGKQSLTRVDISMESLILNIVEEFKSENQRCDISVESILDVKGDSSMLRQVFVNLISNAVKYSQKVEKPTVNIGSYRENENVVYFVKDNGAGFDMKYYDKLFGVFQRLHNSRDFDGTGVGLALVQRIVKKHGGRIWAEAKVNEGATFFVSLPSKGNQVT